MSWIIAGSAGAGLGLAYFGGLWLTIKSVVRQPRRAVWLPVAGLARLLLLGLGLAILCRQGSSSVVAGLGGLWFSRWYILRRFAGAGHGS